jgi:hypothetical protein
VIVNWLACPASEPEKIPIGTRKNSSSLHTNSTILPLECLRGNAVVAARKLWKLCKSVVEFVMRRGVSVELAGCLRKVSLQKLDPI